MAIGMILFGFLAGIGGVLWGINADLSTLAVMAMYPLAGMIGAISFVLVALTMSATREPALVGHTVGETR